MAETQTPSARYSRVTTRRGSLRPLNCPLEPELIVAEFSGELPPEVAQAVREHIAICETCGARAAELRTPYNLLTSLGAEPVPYVPDLRDKVRARASAENRWLGPLRALSSVSRFGLMAVILGVALIALLVVLLRGALLSIGAFSTPRTTNAIAHAPPAAPGGYLLAETNKLVTVSGAGQNWGVAEVIVTDQRNGQVTRSLPNSNAAITTGSSSTLPVAIAADGQSVFELTAPQNDGKQALVVINTATSAIRFILPLTQPTGAALPVGAQAQSLALEANGQNAFIGVGGANGRLLSLRALVVSLTSDKVIAAYEPATVSTTPLPPPPSSLPASAFPSQTPQVSLAGMTFTEAAGGAIGVSPDGAWFFDTLFASDAHGVQYLIVQRISTATGQTTQVLGLPGPWQDVQFAIGGGASSPQLYLVSGSPNATVYVIDASAEGPTLLGQIALGGPTTTNGAHLSDQLSVSPTQDGQHLYVTEDAASTDGVVVTHTRWLLDTQGMGVVASDSEPTTVGALLADSSTSSSAKAFSLINGDVLIGAPDLSSGWTTWLHASDGAPILRLIASEP